LPVPNNTIRSSGEKHVQYTHIAYRMSKTFLIDASGLPNQLPLLQPQEERKEKKKKKKQSKQKGQKSKRRKNKKKEK